MSIKSNIEDIMKEIKDGNTGLGDDIQAEAVEAIKAGMGSDAWIKYMERFSKGPNQMARLEPTDDTIDDADMDIARTYLAGNGMCGAATTGLNLNFGTDKLDDGLSDP